MTSTGAIRFRIATSADVAAIAHSRLSDPAAGPADWRMAAYLDGQHHPQQARLPRVGYVALSGDVVVGYTAGHLTTRYGYEGELQYLFVAPAYRRGGIATALLRLLAGWFREHAAARVCVCIDADSPPAQPFYRGLGASPFRKYWYGWADVGVLVVANDKAT